jgi:hypothetical protein
MEIGWKKRRRQRERGYKPLKIKTLELNLAKYGEYKCECCALSPLKRNGPGEATCPPNLATVDHIIDLGKGGTNSLDNLQVLCFDCNNKKSNGRQCES